MYGIYTYQSPKARAGGRQLRKSCMKAPLLLLLRKKINPSVSDNNNVRSKVLSYIDENTAQARDGILDPQAVDFNSPIDLLVDLAGQ